MTTPAIPERSVWDYKVILKDLQTHEPEGGGGNILKTRVATVDEGSDQILGTVSRKYVLLNNSEVYETINSIADTVGLELESIFVVKYRRATIFRYMLSDNYQQTIVESSEPNDKVNFGFEIINSFDSALGSSRIQAFANRLVCDNGLVLPNTVGKVTFRELGVFQGSVLKDRLIGKIEPMLETANTWNRWAHITPSTNRITSFLSENFTGKARKLLMSTYDTLEDKSVYGVYNMLTYYNTHQTTSRIPEDLRMKQYSVNRAINKIYDIDWEK